MSGRPFIIFGWLADPLLGALDGALDSERIRDPGSMPVVPDTLLSVEVNDGVREAWRETFVFDVLVKVLAAAATAANPVGAGACAFALLDGAGANVGFG